MSLINKLASTAGRRDEALNQDLAKEIVKKMDKAATEELVALLSHKNKDIQSDSIKVLYEIGEQAPELIAPYIQLFIKLLYHKNNRLVWGGMTALDCIASVQPKEIYKELAIIMAASDNGSVITKDYAISILIKLAAQSPYKEQAFTLLLDQFKTAATNQLPMYAENALPVIDPKYKDLFIKVLTARIKDIKKESKQKKVENVIKKLRK